MTAFVAGVHGVGKTYLCKPAAVRLGLTYATASQLIRQELEEVSWDSNKRVTDVERNQLALVAAITRLKVAGHKLALDGHFVLRREIGVHERLPESVFRMLGCASVLLLRCPAETVLQRLAARGDDSWTLHEVGAFASAEREQAIAISNALQIPLIELFSPTSQEFESALHRATIDHD